MRAARFFPFLDTLKTYTTRDFRADFMAALTVTPMAIPQAMAYALIAGVHPQYGIYACMLPVIVAALWGSARYLAAGPTNAISMVLFSTMATVSIGGTLLSSLPEEARMTYVFGLALLCGLIQVGMGLARLGDLANFISHSVMVAFATGAALLIAAGQLKTVLGLTGPKPAGFFPQIGMAFRNLDQINYWSLGLAVLTIVLIVALRRISRRFPSTLIALAVCLIPTTIGALLSAIGIAGMDRVTRFNVIAMSGKAVEACGDVDTMILDKTGTITYGNRMAADFIPVSGVSVEELTKYAALSSLSDATPEGKSVVALAKERGVVVDESSLKGAEFIEFTAKTRMSGVDLPDGTSIRKGASDAIVEYVKGLGGAVPADLQGHTDQVSKQGGTPLTVCVGKRVLGVIYLKDIVKDGLVERFARLRAIGIKTIMCTGDNPLTAATIAQEAGVDGFIAECRPEDKIKVIKEEQAQGKIVAMTGDGTNDAPALAQADVGLAMNSGTTAAKEAANMVDLDSDPTKILEVVEIGKQLLITRGSLTTFSIANDIAKYFAIIPAMFMQAIPALAVLNIMDLTTPYSAILSALIFNAIIIPCLIPLAMKGVKYRPMSSGKMLARNMMIYGVGGVIAPFAGIKIIDMIIAPLLLAMGF